MDIKLKSKLSAYSRGIYPDASKFVTQAPNDDKLYGRKNNEWEEIVDRTSEISEAGPGIDITKDGRYVTISARQETLFENDLPSTLNSDTTYFVIDTTPNIFINGGTAIEATPETSDREIEYNGGDSETETVETVLYPINAEGTTEAWKEITTSKIIFRQDTEARWIEVNPILDFGEPGYAIGVGIKVGDGTHHWNDLLYTAIAGQIQSDLSQNNPLANDYIKNKSTRYLVNEGANGSSPYATEKYVDDNGGKIDNITVNSGEPLPIINKTVNIEIPDPTINTTVIKDQSITQHNDNVSLVNTKVSLVDLSETEETKNIPLATNSLAGLMSPSDYNQIQQNTLDITALKGGTIRLTYSASTNPSAQDIQTFVLSQGYSQDIWPQIIVAVANTSTIWRYYSNTGWVSETTSVNIFTNSEAGIIKGAATDGKVYAESDGTGSVYGWSNLTNNVSDLQTNAVLKSTTIAGVDLQDSITTAELQTALEDSTHRFATDLEISSWTAKQDALTFDSVPTALSDNVLTSGTIYTALSGKVDTVAGKGLSTNDFTDEYKNKLTGIESNAEVNKIATISVNNTTQTVTNKNVNISVPTQTSDLNNDSGFITKTVNDLTYYTTTTDLNTALGNKQDSTDNSLDTTSKTVVGAINEVNSIAKGAQQALAYADYSTMISTFNTISSTLYNIGQSIKIVTLDVPDLWISGKESTSVPYTYTTDAAFINTLNTNGYVQVGYYKLSESETEKVDLSGYVQKTTTIAGVDLQDNITASELRAGLNVANGANVTSISGSGAPTTATVADFAGQLYLDITNNITYQCTAITEDTSTTPSTFIYTWTQLIRVTDTADNNVYGVIKLGDSASGFTNNAFVGLMLREPSLNDIKQPRGGAATQQTILLENIAVAVKYALCGTDRIGYYGGVENTGTETNKKCISMTSEEKQLAQEVLGIEFGIPRL